jgi:membrane associated rhomboid family serine protease
MAFPLSDDNRDRLSTPIVTIVFIVLNVLVFVFLQGMGENLGFTYAFSTVPAEILSGEDKVSESHRERIRTPDGVVEMVVPGLQPTPGSVYLTLLTSMFMHGGWAHLLGNMWFLWIFGDNIEDDLGRFRYVLFYLLAGLLASLTHVFMSRAGDAAMIPSLGASGAISGVMGAYLVMHPQRQVTVLLFRMVTQVPGFVAVGMWFVFQVINGLGMLGGAHSGVAYGAHIGGFVAGAALISLFMLGRPRVPTNGHGFTSDSFEDDNDPRRSYGTRRPW